MGILEDVCTDAMMLGMLLSYFILLRHLDNDEFLRIPARFWFPLMDTSAWYLACFWFKGVIQSVTMHYFVVRRVGCSYKAIFEHWLSGASQVGWQTLILCSLCGTWI